MLTVFEGLFPGGKEPKGVEAEPFSSDLSNDEMSVMNRVE